MSQSAIGLLKCWAIPLVTAYLNFKLHSTFFLKPNPNEFELANPIQPSLI